MGSVQKSKKPSQLEDGDSLMNFGEYNDWQYSEILREKPNYASYICMWSNDSSEENRQFQEGAALKEYESQADGRPRNTRWSGKTCLPAGGILILDMFGKSGRKSFPAKAIDGRGN